MPTRFTHIVVDCAQMRPIAQFWSELLGWPVTFEDHDELYIEGEHMGIVFGEVPEPKTRKNRVHVDLRSESVEQKEKTVARALELGGRRVDIGQGDVSWEVLADPEGNEFCVTDPWPAYGETGAVAAITMDCADPTAIAPLWSAATGMTIARADENIVALRPSGPGPWLALIKVPEPHRIKNRVHIDVAPFAADDQDAEVERLIALGAQRIDIGQGDVPWECMADQEGSEFCVLSPRD